MEKEFYYNVRVRIREKDSIYDEYFGRGIAQLLHGVKEYHSLNLSAKNMGMAYSKAWRVIKEAEEALDMVLLHRMGQKGSSLTEEAEQFLAVYEEAEKEAVGAVQKVFKQYYG